MDEVIAADDADLLQLLKAVREGDATTVGTLVGKRPALVKARDADGQTALHVAAECDDARIGAYLLTVGADPDATLGESAHTALSWAVVCHAMDFAKVMIRLGAKADLFCAAGLGAIDQVKAAFDPSGGLVANASRTGSSRYGADGARLPCPPESKIDQISDALYMACRNGQAEVVQFLLSKQPDLSFRAYDGATPLHWAYFGGSQAAIDLLLAAGADSTLRAGTLGVTPRAFGICTLANWGFGLLVKERLRQDPSLAQVSDGTTPLHEAARGGHAAVVQMLLDAGADRSVVDRNGKTALDLATSGEHAAVVEILKR